MKNQLIADQQWFRSANGKTLLAGSPLTSFTVSDAGAAILDAIEKGHALPPQHESLTSRLLATGAVHPLTDTSVPLSEITVVIPAFVTSDTQLSRLQNLVNSLSGVRVLVVDDASPMTITVSHGQVLRLHTNSGPSTARNAGIAHVSTTFTAFVDADISITCESLQRLASVLRDENVTLAAPRIATENDKTFLGEYESFRSPLDLGTSPAVVRPLSRVSYVPAAVLMGRTGEFQHNPFDESMRLGEDVDFIWRLVEDGRVVRYVPNVVCSHAPRSSWAALLKQRFGYGSSAAHLDKKHPYTAAPLRVNGVLLLPALALLAGYVYFAALLALPTLAYFVFTLRKTRLSLVTLTRLTWIGFRSTVQLMANAIRRAWWPIFLPCTAVLQPALFMVLFSVLAPAAYGIVRSKPRFPGGYFLMRILDDAAYGLGVWVGAFRQRSARCLMPVITFRRTSRTK